MKKRVGGGGERERDESAEGKERKESERSVRGWEGDKAQARALIHGMPFAEWKDKYQSEATPEQLARMEESLKKNAPGH